MKKIILAALLIASTAMAGSISRGGSSFIRSSSATAPARNVGMTRPSVAPAPAPSKPAAPATSAPVRQSTPTYTAAPAPAYTPAPAAPVSTGPSLGGMFASSLGGSLVGTMIGNNISGSHGGSTAVVNTGAAPAAAASAPSVSAPVASYAQPVYQTSSSGVWSVFSSILGLISIVVLIFAAFMAGRWAYRKFVSVPSTDAEPVVEELDVPFPPIAKFIRIQSAFAGKDVDDLRNLLGPNMIDQMLADLPEEASEMTMVGISYDVLDVSSRVVTISYRAFDRADGSDVNERWHFVNVCGNWKLDGIEQNK